MAGLTMREAMRPELTPDEQEFWREEIERRCGICLTESRLYVLRSALFQEMRRAGVETLPDYHRIASQNPAEWDLLLEGVLNHETSFFRHRPSFSALSLELIPRLVASRRRAGDALMLWSAGCSSGEEAYSIAIVAKELLGPSIHPFEVLGSDLSVQALEAARRGRYGPRAVADVPERMRVRYFFRDEGGHAISAGVKSAVRFERFNLIDRATFPVLPQDVIFCQNVLIYFREPVRLKVAASLTGCLRPGGYLVVAPGELAGVRLPGMESCCWEQATVLRRQ